jgi:hypothetical protein
LETVKRKVKVGREKSEACEKIVPFFFEACVSVLFAKPGDGEELYN